jgi:hypothetical protein
MQVSSRNYSLEPNSMRLRSISFVFDGGDTALLSLVTDHEETRLIGLDGAYRISVARPGAEPVAIRGAWTGEKVFEFSYNELTMARHTRAKASFEGDGIILKLTDPWDALDMTIRGRVEQ